MIKAREVGPQESQGIRRASARAQIDIEGRIRQRARPDGHGDRAVQLAYHGQRPFEAGAGARASAMCRVCSIRARAFMRTVFASSRKRSAYPCNQPESIAYVVQLVEYLPRQPA